MHVRENGRNSTDLAGRFGSPGGRVKTFNKNLVHAIIGGKDPDCGLAELNVNLLLTRNVLTCGVLIGGRSAHGHSSLGPNSTSSPSTIRKQSVAGGVAPRSCFVLFPLTPLRTDGHLQRTQLIGKEIVDCQTQVDLTLGNVNFFAQVQAVMQKLFVFFRLQSELEGVVN